MANIAISAIPAMAIMVMRSRCGGRQPSGGGVTCGSFTPVSSGCCVASLSDCAIAVALLLGLCSTRCLCCPSLRGLLQQDDRGNLSPPPDCPMGHQSPHQCHDRQDTDQHKHVVECKVIRLARLLLGEQGHTF